MSDARLQKILDEERLQQDVPGVSAVVIRDGKLIFAGGSGVANIETGHPATADTVYYIGSITKVLTAVLTLHLIEQSELSLDQPVRGISSTAPVSVLHLLTHSSGLEREGDFNYWFTADFPAANDLSAYLERAELRSPPGSQSYYSNVGFAALGPIIESASERSYDEALRKFVLDPLQMNATGSAGPIPELAQAYTPTGRVIPNAEQPFAGVGKPIGDRHVRMYHGAKAMTPAFGAYSTANDLALLAEFLIGDGNEDVLSISGRAQMRQPQPTGRGLGIGVERGRDGNRSRIFLTHGGWFAAHRSQLLIDTTNHVTVIVLANSDSATPRRIADALYRGALRVPAE